MSIAWTHFQLTLSVFLAPKDVLSQLPALTTIPTPPSPWRIQILLELLVQINSSFYDLLLVMALYHETERNWYRILHKPEVHFDVTKMHIPWHPWNPTSIQVTVILNLDAPFTMSNTPLYLLFLFSCSPIYGWQSLSKSNCHCSPLCHWPALEGHTEWGSKLAVVVLGAQDTLWDDGFLYIKHKTSYGS